MRNFLARNRHVTQRVGYTIITLMAVLTVVPIVATVLYILIQGAPAISWEFLTGFPREGMRAGGRRRRRIHSASAITVNR